MRWVELIGIESSLGGPEPLKMGARMSPVSMLIAIFTTKLWGTVQMVSEAAH